MSPRIHFKERWEPVSGECPRCEAQALLGLVVRWSDGSVWIEGERCKRCAWILRYCELDILEGEPEDFRLSLSTLERVEDGSRTIVHS